MKCEECGGKSKVYESSDGDAGRSPGWLWELVFPLIRSQKEPEWVFRRRRCLECGHRWATAEIVVVKPMEPA